MTVIGDVVYEVARLAGPALRGFPQHHFPHLFSDWLGLAPRDTNVPYATLHRPAEDTPGGAPLAQPTDEEFVEDVTRAADTVTGAGLVHAEDSPDYPAAIFPNNAVRPVTTKRLTGSAA